MITPQRRQLVGHDILLARHGNHICSMRLDRSADRVIALLDDGSIDSAPNRIFSELPGTVRGVLREDRKFFAIVSACVTAFAGVMIAAAIGLSGIEADPGMAELMSRYPLY